MPFKFDDILNAVGKLFADYTAKVDAKLSALEKTFAEKTKPTLDELLNDEALREKLKGQDGENGKDADGEAIAAQLKSDADFIEKCRGEMGKPGLDGKVDVDHLLKRLIRDTNFIELTTGKAGADCDASDVAGLLKGDAEFLAQCKGDQGETVQLVDVLHSIKSDVEFIKSITPKDGADADNELILSNLKADADFLAACKGEQGQSVELDSVLHALKSDQAFIKTLQPKNGVDADNDLILSRLKADDDFLAQCKGPRGTDADQNQLLEMLKSDAQFIERTRGENGKDADAKEIAQLCLQNSEFKASCKGEQGEKGEAGQDRPLLSPYVITDDAVQLEKNVTAQFNGSLYQTTRKTNGSPAVDPSSYQLLVAGIESIKTNANFEKREHEFVFTRADGEQFIVTEKMQPSLRSFLPSNAKILAGDCEIKDSVLRVAKIDNALNDSDYSVINLRGEAGEPGKRGRKGMTGNGIAEMIYGDGYIMAAFTDGREPLTIDLKEAVREVLTELNII